MKKAWRRLARYFPRRKEVCRGHSFSESSRRGLPAIVVLLPSLGARCFRIFDRTRWWWHRSWMLHTGRRGDRSPRSPGKGDQLHRTERSRTRARCQRQGGALGGDDHRHGPILTIETSVTVPLILSTTINRQPFSYKTLYAMPISSSSAPPRLPSIHGNLPRSARWEGIAAWSSFWSHEP